MNTLIMISIVQIIFPLIIGLGFAFFPVEQEQVRRVNLYIYCLIFSFLTLISVIVLATQSHGFNRPVVIFGDIQFFPRAGIAKYLLLSPLAYFLQLRQYKEEKDGFSMNIFFQGVFFTLFNLSFYVVGGFSVYCILELLVFSAIILSMINRDFWVKKNIVLQGISTVLIILSLIMTNLLMRRVGPEGQIEVFAKAWGPVDFKLLLAGPLFIGILLKSTMIEYKTQNREKLMGITIYLALIKLYVPLRFFFENDISQIMEANIIEWGILIFCLINCLSVTKEKGRLDSLRLADVFSSLILLGFAILGGDGLYILAKYSFYIAFLLLFYINIEKKERLFESFLLMLSGVAIMRVFYLSPGALEGVSVNLYFLITAIVILYLMIKSIWNLVSEGLNLEKFKSDYLDNRLARCVVLVSMALLLTEIDIRYFVEKGFWIN